MPETCRRARDEIEDLLFEEGSKSFFPLDRLRSYFKYQRIKDILFCSCAQCQEDLRLFNSRTDQATYVNRIMGDSEPGNLTKSYYSVFGLLVYVEHPLFIIGFLDHNCTDFFLESWATHSSQFSRQRLKDYTGDYKRDLIRFERFAKKFSSRLSRFAIPHLDSKGFSQYDGDAVLPFIEEQEIGKKEIDGHWTSEGANGKVYAFKIYREYNRIPNVSLRAEFARKRIKTTQPLAFLERSNIQYVQRFKDEHIVKLVKAYGHGESINLIFPRAWTNLDHLLRDQVFRYGDKRGAKLELADAWKQMLGICRALKKIHGFGNGVDNGVDGHVENRLCIHFDLKPDNILVEKEDGKWLITDFGQAALTERRRGTTPRVGGHFGTDSYAPPEIDDNSMEFGRAYDIWSLGCIMLEVTTFMVLGYAGLKGTNDFRGLDQARQAMPSWARNGDERFFCQETQNGEYVVKKEIREFMVNLEKRHARSPDSDDESKAFLTKVLDLINRMLKPKVSERVNISRVVEILSSALKRASAGAFERRTHQVLPAPDETIHGGPRLNQIELWHRSAANNEWESSSLEVLENQAGFMRLHCWAQGHEPNNISFRRSDVKLLPLYAFWDPAKAWESRTWIDFLFLSRSSASEVSNAKFSFDGNSGLTEARLVQSIMTSQRIVGSFGLSQLVLKRPHSVGKAIKGLFRKMKLANETGQALESDYKSMELGSATIQIWIEEEIVVPTQLSRRESLMSQGTDTIPTVRLFDRYDQKVPPCRVAIYLHRHRFICTVKIDANWVLEENNMDDKVLSFIPHPPGRSRLFYASWIRPTPDELAAGCPAGIPLSPKVLQYYEDEDCVEVEDLQLTFLSAEDREDFKYKFWEVKKDWDDKRQKLDNIIPVNRRPEGLPHLPDGIGQPPLPAKKAQLMVLADSPEILRSTTSSSESPHSRHDSTLDSNAAIAQNPNHLMVPKG